ncbi:NAD-dependent epimerase/dehydratase family protein [Nocardia sp. NPDC050710]|uniref:NAD-dependent epimerase/dehydratase family protein n=1 Tax=Nocardia sp. NPDC050710 TaxID=3157220 RepID=UPI0033F39FDB
MSELHIVTGAGPVGTTVAEQLAAAGRRVRILTRSGSGPDHPLIERRRVNVSQAEQLSGQFDEATAVHHCIHGSRYAAKVWRAELPRAERAVLDEAGRVGAVVTFPESLYSYGRVSGPITENSPRTGDFGKPAVRAELLRARDAHTTPTVSVAAADFLGPYVRSALVGEQVFAAILAGTSVKAFGKLDLPHSVTYVPDLAAAMIRAAADESVWDSVLHAPTAPARTQREIYGAIAAAAGVPEPKIMAAPVVLMRMLGLGSELMRELAEIGYQLDRPFVLDSTASEAALGMAPTPLDQAISETVAWWKTQL